ncbi:MAG: SIS domain-containing protein [Candidatus Thermoplasmatota archaeon]|nr:SIS domain-containing protein [Candidatus Thermoplasmatota archaeon]
MSKLDFDSLLAEYDKSDMAGFTRKFVDDLEAAMSAEIEIESDMDWSGVVCLGMGGSGAGGMFLSALANESGGLPFVVWNNYGMPSWWGPDWLVLATSYSGNTEETLEGVRQALREGGVVVGISSGGELEELLSQSDDALCISIPSGQMPRSAFGHIFGSQLAVCWALGILPKSSEDELTQMLSRLRSGSKSADIVGGDGRVAAIANGMSEKEIAIVSSNEMASVGVRFTNQLNENSERFSRPVQLPEMNHNEIVAWDRNSSSQALLYLASSHTHPRVRARMNWMMVNLEAGDSWLLECEGESLIESLLIAAHITDWISIALAVMNGIDPSEMAAISSLKAHLSTL